MGGATFDVYRPLSEHGDGDRAHNEVQPGEPAHPTGDGPWDRPAESPGDPAAGCRPGRGARGSPRCWPPAARRPPAVAPGASTGSGGRPVWSDHRHHRRRRPDRRAGPEARLRRLQGPCIPGSRWDIRALTGGGPEWDRLARATVTPSGEPVGLVMIDGQLRSRRHSLDGLLADLGADPRMAAILARVPDRYHLAGSGETTTRAFPLAVTRGRQHHGHLLQQGAARSRVALAPPRTIADLKAMVKPLAALGVAPLRHCSGDVFFNQILMTWVLPMIAERTRRPARVRREHRPWRHRLRQRGVAGGLRDDRRPADVGCAASRLRRDRLRGNAAAPAAGEGRDDVQRILAAATAPGRLAIGGLRPARRATAAPRRRRPKASPDPVVGRRRATGRGGRES